MIAARVPLVRSPLLSQFPNVVFGMSTRQGPDAARMDFHLGANAHDCDDAVLDRLDAFFGALGLVPTDAAFMEQVHDTAITSVDEPGIYPATDALLTATPGVALVVRTADCAPIALSIPSHNMIAAIHAGRRGTAAGICTAMVELLRGEHAVQPADILVFIGPSARGCCYEVSDDIASMFPADAVTVKGGAAPRVDLAVANLRHLLDAGVPRENIDIDPLCTICHSSLFHSHRRDGAAAGRMLAVIALRDEL
jgi:polyphenol oxidase